MNDLILWQSLVVQAINIAIIVFVLQKLLFKPYLKYIDDEVEKRKVLEASLADSSKLIEQSKKEAQGIIDEAKKDAKSILSNAETLWKNQWALLISEASLKSQQIKEDAMKEIENERKRMEGDVRDKILKIAVKLNEKLFGEKGAHEAFLKKQLDSSSLQ